MSAEVICRLFSILCGLIALGIAIGWVHSNFDGFFVAAVVLFVISFLPWVEQHPRQ